MRIINMKCNASHDVKRNLPNRPHASPHEVLVEEVIAKDQRRKRRSFVICGMILLCVVVSDHRSCSHDRSTCVRSAMDIPPTRHWFHGHANTSTAPKEEGIANGAEWLMIMLCSLLHLLSPAFFNTP